MLVNPARTSHKVPHRSGFRLFALESSAAAVNTPENSRISGQDNLQLNKSREGRSRCEHSRQAHGRAEGSSPADGEYVLVERY